MIFNELYQNNSEHFYDEELKRCGKSNFSISYKEGSKFNNLKLWPNHVL